MGLILPVDFENKMKKILGDEWENFRFCYENDKYQALRINPSKVSSEEIDNLLAKFDLVNCEENQVPWETNGYYYSEQSRPGKHPYHEMGLYYIQEPSAMSAAALLDIEPGMRVLDLCAAPGGKTTQLAAKLSGEGLLVANEINSGRAKILSSNIERLGYKNVLVTNEDSFKLAANFVSFFDAILVDAPCSGEGMFRKNPDAMDEWSLDNVKLCADRQAEILDNAAKMLKPGGALVYSTCTFAVEENEESIRNFLERHEEFKLEYRPAPWFSKTLAEYGQMDGAYRLWPHKLHGEGHFVCALRKAGTLDSNAGDASRKKNKDNKAPDKNQVKLLYEFLDKTIAKAFGQWIKEGELALFGDQLYRLPGDLSSIKGIHVLRCGLHLGEYKKNRFEPSHALALAVKKCDLINSINISSDSNECFGYFNGESIILPEESDIKGWCLVCVDGYPAGWSKASNGQFKNHYPKGLRRNLRLSE